MPIVAHSGEMMILPRDVSRIYGPPLEQLRTTSRWADGGSPVFVTLNISGFDPHRFTAGFWRQQSADIARALSSELVLRR